MTIEEIINLYELYNDKPVTYIKMNDDGDHDVDLKQIKHQIDIETIHSKDELNAIVKLNELLNSKVELKNCQSMDSLFVEYSIDKKGNGFIEPSGILTSNAPKWRFTQGLITFEFELEFLKYLYNNRELLNIKDADNSKYKVWIPYGMKIVIGDLTYLQQMYYKSGVFLKKINKRLKL